MNNKYIKLLIGAVLFGTLVALTVLQVPHSERLIDMLYGALVGMGIMHIGSQSSATSPDVSKQAGFASIAMLIVIAATALLFTGTATAAPSPTPPVQANLPISMDEQIASTYAALSSVRASAHAAVAEKRMTADDADLVLGLTDHARALLVIAMRYHASWQDAAASPLVEQAAGITNKLQAALSVRGVK